MMDILSIALSVNMLVNSQISYKPEKVDYWATAEETLKSKEGDCEDYATLKRTLLAKEGVRSKMAYVRSRDGAHMVALVGDYVLDNMTPEVKALAERSDLKVIASFDEDTIELDGKILDKPAESLFPQFARVKVRVPGL